MGSIVKAYVLFRKKDKGMALTLDKAKAKEMRKEENKKAKEADVSMKEEKTEYKLEAYLPKGEEIDKIKDKYKSFMNRS